MMKQSDRKHFEQVDEVLAYARSTIRQSLKSSKWVQRGGSAVYLSTGIYLDETGWFVAKKLHFRHSDQTILYGTVCHDGTFLEE
ncbi:MAG: hypothetical protein H0V70_30425 [Ktedonobacteraceae bacterium]|jgi:hypothetical protein|nr:hypothetical protein [Ktedonobacteraceae bacterium]